MGLLTLLPDFFLSLQKIDLSKSYHARDGLDAAAEALIAQALETDTNLKCLNLSFNSFGGISIARALQVNSTLRHISLAHSIGPRGGIALARALRINTTLEQIDLAGNDLGPEVGVEVAHMLCANTTIQRINLECNNFGSRAGAEFARALKINNTLRRIWLRGNGFGKNVVMRIGAVCANKDALIFSC